jgi:hypothetical protein
MHQISKIHYAQKEQHTYLEKDRSWVEMVPLLAYHTLQ